MCSVCAKRRSRTGGSASDRKPRSDERRESGSSGTGRSPTTIIEADKQTDKHTDSRAKWASLEEQ